MLWSPSEEFKNSANLTAYIQFVNQKLDLNVGGYEELREWSIQKPDEFWQSIWDFYQVDATGTAKQVISEQKELIGTKWFEGTQVNYAEHIFRNKTTNHPAIVFWDESKNKTHWSWQTLEEQTSNFKNYLVSQGVQAGDRVVSMMPNAPETVAAFLATNSIGAIWSSCSPDFGDKSIIDRFQQIQPKVFLTTNGYTYNGRIINKKDTIEAIQNSLETLVSTVLFEYITTSETAKHNTTWQSIQSQKPTQLEFNRVDFNAPLWILYSSGTTGKPKAITHSMGGILIEHLKALGLHQNVKKGERFFWYSTTGWMMWNYAVASLLHGATLCLYEGSPAYPEATHLWDFASKEKIDHFGAGAAYYLFCLKEGFDFTKDQHIPKIKSFGSTGSPLPPEGFQWFYNAISPDSWVVSLSGGTDICSGFVGGCPLEPVYEGEIQCRMLGVDLKALDESGSNVVDALGEMVIEKPMPSMPIYFWNDEGNLKYHSSYFELYPGKWRHGDWIKITPHGSVIIYGRSDATLNRGGVRIGTSEVYSAVESTSGVQDALVVCIDYADGSQFMPIFIQTKNNIELNNILVRDIKKNIKTQYSPRHIPDQFIQVDQIPYTISGKKLEAPVKKILSGIPVEKAASKDAMRNPEALNFFVEFYQKMEKRS